MTNTTKSEFNVQNAKTYNHSSTTVWLLSHLARHWPFALLAVAASIINSAGQAAIAFFTGKAFDIINQDSPDLDKVRTYVLYIGLLGLFYATGQLCRNYSFGLLAQRLERDTREELYISLLGKSQTFHDRQRIGDVMARATDDVRQLNMMLNPGLMLIVGSSMSLIVPLISIALLRAELLLSPVVFTVLFYIALWDYTRRLRPVTTHSRTTFGIMNAGLQETISGIELVKSSAQEHQEQAKFVQNARKYRDYMVQQGEIEGRYLPLLMLSLAITAGFLHAVILYDRGEIPVGTIIAYIGIFGILRFPTFISIFTFSLVQLGYAGATRILSLIKAEADIDENTTGHRATIQGDIEFKDVSFGYYGADNPVLKNVSFKVQAGQTVAIVGQTGSGKTSITRLINRIYDANSGQVLLDAVDVRDWALDSLRSQISVIEQDVFLFSRTVAENIAFGVPGATQADIERAAQAAQAHDFIMKFESGYETMVGERGVTLSGGQRQRIALARAFLTDPRILIMDDSTSAVDSATEDEIQKAIRRVQEGRTVVLITHRLSQIRWADIILVVKKGRIVAQGSHEHLLATSADYRSIFARYEVDLPPLVQAEVEPVA